MLAEIEGRPILERVIASVRQCEDKGLVRATYVVSAATGLVALLAEREGAIAVPSPRADEGLAQSLRAGLARVEASAPAGPAAMLVLLGDQPGVRAPVIEAVIRRWRASGSPLVRPRYAEEPLVPGHPVLVDRSLWPRIATLDGDAGLGSVIAGVEVALVDVPGCNPDIDTREDLLSWTRKGTD